MSDLLEIDRRLIWHPFTPLQGALEPQLITSANGVYLHTQDGRKIIDAVSSWWVNLHGHANAHIAKAIAEQALKLEHVIFAGFTHEPAIRLAENLLSILPKNQAKIFFSDNGSTAVEVALKMALQYWYNLGIKKTKVIAIDGAYHGDTFGSMSVGERSAFTDPFKTFLFDTTFIDFPNRKEDGVIKQFEALASAGDVAAFIYEPLVQGASGMRMYSPAVLNSLLHIAKSYSVLCIADEVFTGFGRTGKNFASDYCTHQPDIMAVSKGITGGTMALGVTTCTQQVLDAYDTSDFIKTFFHGHSYTGNPLACAAANASFELFTRDACQENIRRISSQHVEFAKELIRSSKVENVRTLGTILAFDLKTNEATAYGNSVRKKIYPYFLTLNVLLRPLGNVIYILPPYIITNEELALVYASIQSFLDVEVS